MVNRVSPLVTPQLSSAPTDIGEGAVGLAPACLETYPLTFPGSLMGVAGPPAVPLLLEREAVGLARPPYPRRESWNSLPRRYN